VPAIERQLQTARRPVLLSRPGLIARYDLMPMISRIAADAGTPGHIPLVLLLVPMAVSRLPRIDRPVVPRVWTSPWGRIPRCLGPERPPRRDSRRLTSRIIDDRSIEAAERSQKASENTRGRRSRAPRR